MRTLGFGRALFGISVAGLAAMSFVYGNFAPIIEARSTWLPRPEAWVYGSGAILLAASAGLFFARSGPGCAVIIGAYELVWLVARTRPVLLKPLDVGSLYGFGEALGPLLAAWMLYGLLRRQSGAPSATAMTGDRALCVARILFGAACVAYGAAHFAYAAYTAKMVPAWLPGPTGLVYFTGACHAAAGLGLVIGVLPRLAATLEAVMLSLFGVLVWLPSFFASPIPGWASPKQTQWSETFLSFLLASSAWILAASLQGRPWGFPRTAHRDPATPGG
jgi:uncharacterized membrane protein YphA (DoxX/SURF4 family)